MRFTHIIMRIWLCFKSTKTKTRNFIFNSCTAVQNWTKNLSPATCGGKHGSVTIFTRHDLIWMAGDSRAAQTVPCSVLGCGSDCSHVSVPCWPSRWQEKLRDCVLHRVPIGLFSLPKPEVTEGVLCVYPALALGVVPRDERLGRQVGPGVSMVNLIKTCALLSQTLFRLIFVWTSAFERGREEGLSGTQNRTRCPQWPRHVHRPVGARGRQGWAKWSLAKGLVPWCPGG